MDVLIAAAMSAVAYVVVWKRLEYVEVLYFALGNELADYHARHLDCVVEDGGLCYVCGGSHIRAEQAADGKHRYNHHCEACACVLCKSDARPKHAGVRDRTSVVPSSLPMPDADHPRIVRAGGIRWWTVFIDKQCGDWRMPINPH